MEKHHELRWGGLAGIGFVALALIAYFLPGVPERVDRDASTIASYVADNRNTLLVAALLWSAAAVLLLWFAAAFTEAIQERAERTDVHLALLAGAVLVASAVFGNAALMGANAYGVETNSTDLTVMLYQASAVMVTLIGFAAALPLAAAGIGVIRTHLMPNWLGYFAFLAAIVSVIGAFGIFVDSGAFVPGGPVMALIPLLVAAAWVLCGSYFMVREHLPAVAGIEPMPQA
jgi:Domain of unknown function (DUF4386)